MLAEVATLTSGDDVAKVMLTAFADRDDVFNLQVTISPAVSATMIELNPSAP